MAVYSMFETLMSLPLFKGASEEQISAFVEKTHLSFKSFNPGEKIALCNDTCRTLWCLISGEMEVSHPLFSGKLIVRERVGSGRFIGVEHLFGLDNRLGLSAMALSRCGTMEIQKQQYMSLLQNNQIFLMNIMNYLARSSQKCYNLISAADVTSLVSLLARIVDVTTTNESTFVSMESAGVPLFDFFSNLFPNAEAQLRYLAECGVVEIVSDRQIAFPSRVRLMEHV